MKKSILLLVTLFCAASCARDNVPLYKDTTAPLEQRVEDALSRLTLEEKVAMLSAQSKFSSPGVPRLGIPDIWMSDGPFGVREDNRWDEWGTASHTNDSCTAFPALSCLAATWDRDMALRYGQALGEESRYRGKTVQLAPGVNIFRTPLCGRNFEYMGEDPLLVSRMAVPYIQGIQQNHVAACIKHYALNNQEAHRHDIECVIGDRALREIYLPAFEAAVKDGGVWSVMGAYNKYKGKYCCENAPLVNGILKGEWGFDGVMVSDWGGATNTDDSVNGGLDLEFGTWTDGLTEGLSNAYPLYCLADAYENGLKSGKYSIEGLDDKVRRVLRLIFRTTMSGSTDFGSFASPEHFALSREIASEGITLLKNDADVLPIALDGIKKILVVGDNATARHIDAGGSMYLKTKYEITPLEGILSAVGDRAEVRYVRGYRPCPAPGEPEDAEALRNEAVEAAKDADIVLFFGGHNRWAHQDCEGLDKLQYNLPYCQDALIEALGAVTDRLVVTLITGTSVPMPWADSAESILYGWYGGSEGGNAVADVLFGKKNPSGRLPFTIAKALDDYPMHHLGLYDPDNAGEVVYGEGIYVGYRWFDKMDIEPQFPFGYGLSYTDFEFGEPSADRKSIKEDGKIRIRVPVRNVGKREGSAVVQLYAHRTGASQVDRPERELKDFGKISLAPGEKGTVELELPAEALRWYYEASGCWRVEKGDYEAQLGTSSRDLFASIPFAVK